MKEYELTVLIHPDLEVDIETPINKIHDIVKSNGGTITSEDNWGKKRLAYKIKAQEFAVYVYMEVSLPADAPLKISNTLNITDEVIRYLLVTINEKGRRALEEQALSAKSRSSNSTSGDNTNNEEEE
jgi:small subunit ribosomal protein S6